MTIDNIQLPPNAKSMFWNDGNQFHAGSYMMIRIDDMDQDIINDIFGSEYQCYGDTTYEWHGYYIYKDDNDNTCRVPLNVWRMTGSTSVSLWCHDRSLLYDIRKIIESY